MIMHTSFSTLFLGLLGSLGLVAVTAQSGPPPIAPEIFYLFTAAPALVPTFNKYETPIASRFTSYYDATWWNCVAALSSEYKDSFSKERPAVVSTNPDSHTTSSRATCVTQATASLNDLFFGGIDAYLDAMDKDFPQLTIEGEVPESVKNCLITSTVSLDSNSGNTSTSSDNRCSGSKSDKVEGPTNGYRYEANIACLSNVALQNNYNPTTMGHIIAMQTFSYALNE